MGSRQSEMVNFTIIGADVEPLNLQGARQVLITCIGGAGAARIYREASATGSYFPLDVAYPNPIVFNSQDGYLYLRNENQGGATDATVFVWLVF